MRLNRRQNPARGVKFHSLTEAIDTETPTGVYAILVLKHLAGKKAARLSAFRNKAAGFQLSHCETLVRPSTRRESKQRNPFKPPT
jgi:hypothetical protein